MDDETQKLEQEANQLALEILMPKEQFIAVWNQKVKEKNMDAEDVGLYFGVSGSVATARAIQLLGEFTS